VWKLPDSLAQRFPLVARARPTCLPLPQRVQALTDLADTAAKQDDPSVASTVYNQAALLASDIGDVATARAMCHQHADAYLHATPLSGTSAIRALEPVVNLARLQLRSGQGDQGRRRLLELFDAVTNASPIEVDDISVPAELVAKAADRQEVRTWLWTVLLADGTRSLTASGRWSEALVHVQTHRGVGLRMLDGRQVAVIAALTSGDNPGASNLLNQAVPQEAWEEAVMNCLNVLYRRSSGQPWRRSLRDLVTTYLERPDRNELAVFDTRLGLAVLDVVDTAEGTITRSVVAELHRRVTRTMDGYSAREALAHPLFTALATDQEAQDCRALLEACSLGAGPLPTELGNRLTAALRTSDRVIRRSASSL
jgi:peptidoglycan hydrolase-like protein with peptidoglycan-binding domain